MLLLIAAIAFGQDDTRTEPVGEDLKEAGNVVNPDAFCYDPLTFCRGKEGSRPKGLTGVRVIAEPQLFAPAWSGQNKLNIGALAPRFGLQVSLYTNLLLLEGAYIQAGKAEFDEDSPAVNSLKQNIAIPDGGSPNRNIAVETGFQAGVSLLSMISIGYMTVHLDDRAYATGATETPVDLHGFYATLAPFSGVRTAIGAARSK